MKKATLKITGKVQSVFLRSEIQEKAQSLGLQGYALSARREGGSVWLCHRWSAYKSQP
jgi:acylphosphatase